MFLAPPAKPSQNSSKLLLNFGIGDKPKKGINPEISSAFKAPNIELNGKFKSVTIFLQYFSIV